MNQEELMSTIADIEREIALLPEGSITKKKIRDRDYYYHRISRNGKRVENYIAFDEVEGLRIQIERRKELERDLKYLTKQIAAVREIVEEVRLPFKTAVRTGNRLRAQIAPTAKLKKRSCISELREYIFGDATDKVFILYGLRRTGKTTLIRQILTEFPEEELRQAAFIQVRSRDTLEDLDEDIRLLEAQGFRYVFIDEVTLIDDFVEGAAIFSDVYASSGMKIVLSGTDSLGFAFSKSEQLYDRCIMLHTTFIPYREFEEVLGIKGIEEYIRYGGTMSLSGINYNGDAIFASARSAEQYIDTAIAKNIQHALKMYEYGGHFRSLLELYEKGELTNVINRVIENINHRFTKQVVEQTFRSHDIAVTSVNLLRDREEPVNIKANMDLDEVTRGMMQMLDILNREEQSVRIKDYHMAQIEEYLSMLDLIMKVDLESLPDVSQGGELTVITQPGMRYAQAKAIVTNLLLDEKFSELSVYDRHRILNRLLSEICGRMMEEIVLLETKLANPDKQVFKLQFAVGEFDMVVFNPEELCCRIYEVKYSKDKVSEQSHHLRDEEKCAMTRHRYGDIVGRYVIYRGEAGTMDGIEYLNVEEYLKSL